MLKEVAKSEAQPGLKFKVVESGGRTVKSSVQQSNPTTISGCQSGDCVACKGVGGQEDPAGNPMVCISIPASAARQTISLYWRDCKESVHKRQRTQWEL